MDGDPEPFPFAPTLTRRFARAVDRRLARRARSVAVGPGAFLDLGGDPRTARWADVRASDGSLRARIFFDPDGCGADTIARIEHVDRSSDSVRFFDRKPPSRAIHPDPSRG